MAGSEADMTKALARTIIRPVSNVTFDLAGDDVFERSLALVVEWMKARNAAIPAEASRGVPFDIGGGGTSVARATRIDYEEGRVWSATIDDPDDTQVGRTWITEFTIGEYHGGVHFGSRLLNFTRGDEEAFTASVPGIVRDLVREFDCTVDGQTLSQDGTLITTPDDLDTLCALLERPDRRLPVVVLAESRDRQPRVPLRTLVARLTGAAHVVGMTDECADLLVQRIGRSLSVYNGAVRLYRPGLRFKDADPFEHPLWLAYAGRTSERGDVVVTRVLASSLASPNTDYPRFDAVRATAISNELAERRARSPANDPDLVRLLEEQNATLGAKIEKADDELNQWLADAEATRTSSDQQIAELLSDLHHSRSQNDALRQALATGGSGHTPRAPLTDLSNFRAWATANLSPRIWISDKAIKETERNGQYRTPEEIGDALYALDEVYAPMRCEAQTELKTTWDERSTALGISVTPCFKREGDLKRHPEYSVSYRGGKHWCHLHLKRGGGTDPKGMFRIYFLIDEDEQRILIGHMPSHLDNNMTN